MAKTNGITTRLPQHLHAAYDWTDAAGELDELATLEGEALDSYCRESAANAEDHGESDVSELELDSLAAWLRDEHMLSIEAIGSLVEKRKIGAKRFWIAAAGGDVVPMTFATFLKIAKTLS